MKQNISDNYEKAKQGASDIYDDAVKKINTEFNKVEDKTGDKAEKAGQILEEKGN